MNTNYKKNNSRSKALHALYALGRIFTGLWWLYEAIMGNYWEIGLHRTDIELNSMWLGPDAGIKLTMLLQQAFQIETWSWFAWLINNVFLPITPMWSVIIILSQLLLGISYLLGPFNCPFALLGLSLEVPIILIGFYHMPSWLFVLHLFILAVDVGQHYRIDGYLLQWKTDMGRVQKRMIRFAILLRPDSQTGKCSIRLGTISIGVAMYFLLQAVVRAPPYMNLIRMDSDVILILVSLGLCANVVSHTKTNMIVAAQLLNYMRYKLVWMIWASMFAVVINIPDLLNIDEVKNVLLQMVDSHWMSNSLWLALAQLLTDVIIPVMGCWVLILSGIQLLASILFIIGYRTLTTLPLAVVLVTIYMFFSFTR